MDSNLYYESHLLSFVDILGFTNLITSKNCNSEYEYLPIALNRLLEICKEVVNCDQPILSNFRNNSLKTFNISDSILRILACTEPNRSNPTILNELYTLCLSQFKLTKFDILIRGAVTWGDLYHDNNTVFGPCLIDALTLEKTSAIYPRIIISNSLLSHLENDNDIQHSLYPNISPTIKPINYLLKKGDDDIYFLDYLKVAYEENQNNSLLLRHRTKIEKKVRKARNNKQYSHISKLIWLADYHNDFIDTLSRNCESYREYYCQLD